MPRDQVVEAVRALDDGDRPRRDRHVAERNPGGEHARAAAVHVGMVEMERRRAAADHRAQPQEVERDCGLAEELRGDRTQHALMGERAQRRPFADRAPERAAVGLQRVAPAGAGGNAVDRRLRHLADRGKARHHLAARAPHRLRIEGAAQQHVAVAAEPRRKRAALAAPARRIGEFADRRRRGRVGPGGEAEAHAGTRSAAAT